MYKEFLNIDKNFFIITQKNIPEVANFLSSELKKFNLNDKEIYRAQLLVEESFVVLKNETEKDENFSAKVRIKKRFGNVHIIVSAKGDELNPIANLPEKLNSEDEKYYNLAILKAYRNEIGYARKDGENCISILIHERGGKQNFLTFACLFGGIFFGIFLKNFCGEDFNFFIEENILKSVREMFINGLSMMVAPLIFFSVISGITNIKDPNEVGRIGSKLVFISIAKGFVMVLLGVFFALILFENGIPELVSLISNSQNFEPANFSLREMIVGIVPNNLVAPFAKGNILEVLFLACFFGIVINRSGERAHYVKELIIFFNQFCIDAMNIIIKLTPIVVFASMAAVTLTLGTDLFLLLFKIIFGAAFGAVITIFINGIAAGIVGKFSPIKFIKKIVPFVPVPFFLMSSNPCIPPALKFCEEKLGIEPKLSMFSIPVGIQFNMNGHVFYFAFTAILMAKTFGIDVDANLITTVIISALLISCSMTGAPGGVIIALPPIFSAIGVPIQAVTIFVCIFSLIGMFTTIGNVIGNIGSTLILAKSENKLDTKIYST